MLLKGHILFGKRIRPNEFFGEMNKKSPNKFGKIQAPLE